MIERRTVCPYDCPDSCGMIAQIEDGRVLAVRGDKEHPRTRGFLCQKTQHYEEMVNHPDRILYPMKRVGRKGDGSYERISWQEALDIISGRWKEIIRVYGPEAILPYSYAGTEGKIQEKCGEAFFHYMGASKLKRTICAAGKAAGWKAVMGDSMGMPVHKLRECDRILIWSSNIAATRLHEIPYIQEARRRGARVTLIEVYDSPASIYCDDVILVKPGSDGALALAMIQVMEANGLTDHHFIEEYVTGYDRLLENLHRYSPEWAAEITGVPVDQIRELALSYGQAERPAILLGSGVSRQKNGAMSVRCISSLPAIVGSLKKGYGVTGLNQTEKWGDMSKITRPDFDRNHARTINMMQLARALDPEQTREPVVKSLYVYSSNPAVVTTNQKVMIEQLEREDLFTVVHERFMTDTARYADIILPAVFSLESYDLFTGYGYNALQYAKKIIEAPGECLSNWDTFCRLAQAMGYDDPYFHMSEEEKCMEYLDHQTGQQADLNEEEWKRLLDGYAIERPLSGSLDIRTEDGRIMLYNKDLSDPLIAYRPIDGGREYPLHLVAAPSKYTLNSTFTSQERLIDARGPMNLILSAQDAEARDIRDGDRILCYNELAEVEFYARVIDRIAEQNPDSEEESALSNVESNAGHNSESYVGSNTGHNTGDNAGSKSMDRKIDIQKILPGTVVAEGIYERKYSLNGYTVNALFHEELSDLGQATTMNGNFVEVKLKKKPV